MQDGGTVGADHKEIRAAQVRLLYEQLPSALIATIVNAIILVAVLWPEVPTSLLSVWLLLTLSVAIGRHILGRAYVRNVESLEDSSRWQNYFAYGAAASSLLWGFAGFFFFIGTSYPHQVFLAFVLAGMVSGGVVTLSSVRGVYKLFLLLALLPYASRLVIASGELHLA